MFLVVFEDTTPKLRGSLVTNGNSILITEDSLAMSGANTLIYLLHDATTNVDYTNETYITAHNHGLSIEANSGGHVRIKGPYGSGTLAKFNTGGAAELYYNYSKLLETANIGIAVSGSW